MSGTMFFKCDRCDNVDHIKATPQPEGQGWVCHRCLNGSWHGAFPEEKYNPEAHRCINTDNSQYGGLGEPSFS